MDINTLNLIFKEKLKEKVLGTFSKTCDPAFIEIMGYAGLDFVIIDMEHATNNMQTIQNLIRAAQIGNIFPIVRVKNCYGNEISEVLDIGAGGVQIPMITTKTEAEEVINKIKFFPKGNRGICRYVRSACYSGKDRFKYIKDSNEAITVLQIEGEKGIENIDEILSVKGIDIIFIGPYDLSQSLGLIGQTSHPLVEEKMLDVVKKCNEKNIYVGTFVDNVSDIAKWHNKGVKYIPCSTDVGMFYESIQQLVNQ